MAGLARTITSNMDQILPRMHLGRAHWDDLVDAIERAEGGRSECYDEQLWTFVLACLYAMDGEGPSKLAAQLTKTEDITADKLWFEVKSRSPRINEGQTVLDLALGDINLRKGTRSGIELGSGKTNNIVFCEFKWCSDLDYRVSYDLHRNQLARVIENALFFRSSDGRFAKQAHVCLVTPKIFRERNAFSRFYRYKWNEYDREGHQFLIADLRDCKLEYEHGLPNISDRVRALRLSWMSYEQIAFSAPSSPIRGAAKEFYDAYKGSELG